MLFRSSPGSPAPSATGRIRPGRWQPRPGVAWQWQLDGEVRPSADVPVYDIDGFENTAADVARLHRAGRRVICYVDVGTWERFRPDAHAFPGSVLGRPNGWPGERWLDVRRLGALEPILRADAFQIGKRCAVAAEHEVIAVVDNVLELVVEP